VTTRVTIDADLCIGSGDCSRVAPAAYRLLEDQGVSVPTAEAPATDPALLVRAAVACPTQAITLVAEDGSVLHRGNA
jgi:ferredoxin